MIYMGDNVMRITHIESSYSSRRIPWNHLYLHTEVAEQVRPLGLEASTFPKSNPKYQYPKGKKNLCLWWKNKTWYYYMCWHLNVVLTCVFVKDELNLRASIVGLDVVKSPCRHIVSTEWHIDRLPWSSTPCSRDHKQ